MDRATSWVRAQATAPDPFLLVYSCKEPHPPFGAPDPFHEMYAPEEVPPPATRHDPAGPRLQELRRDPYLQAQILGLSDDQHRRVQAAYRGSVSYVDHLVGRLVTTLIDTDQWQNTLFIYTSDHGEMLGHHGIFGQFAVLYEDVTRIPLIVRPPGGLARGATTGRLVSHVDLVPTIVTWCGGDRDEMWQGEDAGEIVRGHDAEFHDGVVSEYHSAGWTDPLYPMRAWVTDRWKYVETLDDTGELYDLNADREELHNLIKDPAHDGDLRRVRAEFDAWKRRSDDAWPEVVQPPAKPSAPA